MAPFSRLVPYRTSHRTFHPFFLCREVPMKRVTIVGGGLAGLTLGLQLRQRGVPVLLHEAGTYPRHRVCGEYLSGRAISIIESLGLRPGLDDLGAVESSDVLLPIRVRPLPSPGVDEGRRRYPNRPSCPSPTRGGNGVGHGSSALRHPKRLALVRSESSRPKCGFGSGLGDAPLHPRLHRPLPDRKESGQCVRAVPSPLPRVRSGHPMERLAGRGSRLPASAKNLPRRLGRILL
ncbi:MAG: hypothetical protein EBS69_03705 [Verrucomicrobia bacterium]|nr:hypothetical protein [Verrucomicrobiota bacterium]